MSMKISDTMTRYSGRMKPETLAVELNVMNDQTSLAEKKNRNGMMPNSSDAAIKLSPRMIQFRALFLAAATFNPSLSMSTLARLPSSLWVRLFAHSETVFCGQAQPHQTVPMVM